MARWERQTLTDQQRRWFASLQEGLERDSGRSLQAWADLAAACPPGGHRARLAWMKAEFGLGQNRASLILAEAFPGEPTAAATGTDPLWSDPAARAVFEALSACATALPDVLVGRRKGYTAFSRRWQFAAARPSSAGGVLLGLALPFADDPHLRPRPRAASWSERLTASIDLAVSQAVGPSVAEFLARAWAAS